MSPSNFRLSRRSVLRGAAGVAIALPWLEIMEPVRPSRAAPLPAKRFLSVYTPGGTVLPKWTPTGTETAFTLSPILAPFEPVKKQLLVLSGLDMKSAVGEQYQSGMVALLTGTKQTFATTLAAAGPSIDQVLAVAASAGKKFPSLQFALRWGTGKSDGAVSPINILNYAHSETFEPIAPSIDPVAIWNSLFGDVKVSTSAGAWDKSILDALVGRYTALSRRLGTADRKKLEQHLSKIRELEQRLAQVPATCAPPTLIDTSDYDPFTGRNSADDGSIVDLETDSAIPKVGKLMMDMMVMALACDLTAVGTLQWSDSESKYTLPWLNLSRTHRFYMNDGGYHPLECEAIATWYSQQSAYLLQQMASVDMGGHSLLDESVVFFGSEGQDPATHAKTDMPFLLAGGGGGLRGGRFLSYPHVSHNGLLASIFNLFGDSRTAFGDPAYVVPPLDNLV